MKVKGIFILVIILTFFSCKEERPKNYSILKGLIANNSAENIDIKIRGYDKRIKVNSDGTFQDTLKVLKEGYHSFYDGKNKSLLHIKNGDVIEIQYDYKDFDASVKYSGYGFETSKYLHDRKFLDKKEGTNNLKAFFKLNSNDFTNKVNRIEKEFAEILNSKGIDTVLKKNELSRNTKTIAYLKKNYAKEHDYLTKFAKGTQSPKFVNYEKFGGGKVSLDDFKGKYVYIDVWATWCGPCKREIPYLKTLTEEYKDKNIEFISISVDNGRGYKNDAVKAKKGWEKMIREKETKWLQLYADKAWSSDFIKAYGIRSIPRFILIDNEGRIVNANAPRPSNKKLKQIIDGLLN